MVVDNSTSRGKRSPIEVRLKDSKPNSPDIQQKSIFNSSLKHHYVIKTV